MSFLINFFFLVFLVVASSSLFLTFIYPKFKDYQEKKFAERLKFQRHLENLNFK